MNDLESCNNMNVVYTLKLKVDVTRIREFQSWRPQRRSFLYTKKVLLQNKDKILTKQKQKNAIQHNAIQIVIFNLKVLYRLFLVIIIVPRSSLYKIKHNCRFYLFFSLLYKNSIVYTGLPKSPIVIWFKP